MGYSMGMKTETVCMSVEDFFRRDDVKALQEIQKRNPCGSKPHREAFEQMAALAKAVGGDLGEY